MGGCVQHWRHARGATIIAAAWSSQCPVDPGVSVVAPSWRVVETGASERLEALKVMAARKACHADDPVTSMPALGVNAASVA